MRPLYASILATTTALQTCKVQDLATRRVAGALLAPFGGRAGAAHGDELVGRAGSSTKGREEGARDSSRREVLDFACLEGRCRCED